GSVTLSCVTPLPTGITCGFGPTNVASLSVTPTVAGTTTNVRITVANGTALNQYTLTVRAVSGTTTIATAPLGINVGIPTITGITPSTGAWGQTVTISGSAFNFSTLFNTVLFNGVQGDVVGATTTSLSVVVPQNSSSGNVTVTTTVGT